MAHSYHHAVSSVRKWGGTPDDYIAVHTWLDSSKEIIADFRHRALRHHCEGIFLAERLFGVTITLSTGRIVPVRLIAEQHVLEDLGRIPSFADWVRAIRPEPWMGHRSEIGSGDGEGSTHGRVCNAIVGTTDAVMPAPT